MVSKTYSGLAIHSTLGFGTRATMEALPEVVDAVRGRIPVLIDGGIRRGSDVLKALAQSAKAVMIGRPYVWGLAAFGVTGVERVIDLLRAELASRWDSRACRTSPRSTGASSGEPGSSGAGTRNAATSEADITIRGGKKRRRLYCTPRKLRLVYEELKALWEDRFEKTPTVFSRSRYHRPQISIEPVQDLFDNDFRGGHVSATEEHMALVLRWCPQKPKRRLLLEVLLYALLQRMRTACNRSRRNGIVFFDEGHGEYRKLYRRARVFLPTGSMFGGWRGGAQTQNMPLDNFTKDSKDWA